MNALNIIHIAGTSGKGSTVAWVESFLNAHRIATKYPQKIGSYSSPHLTSIRERIRLNGECVEEGLFAWGVEEVLNKLPKTPSASIDKPRYLQCLALVALHLFIHKKAEVVILETHMGGEYDATNVVTRPRVVGITPIGRDHTEYLGPTVGDIAWHKAGILKKGATAFSAPQAQEVSDVLKARSVEKGCNLGFVAIDSELPRADSLRTHAQRVNCSLALALVRSFLEQTKSMNAEPFAQKLGLQVIHSFLLRGRFHRIQDDKCQWYLDGAHNETSLNHAVDWFVKETLRAR